MSNQPIYHRLLGALVGLVRATEGNEDLVNKNTDALVLEALRLDGECATAEVINALIERIIAEKKRLIPNCFCCTASCGRNDDYDMQELYNAPEDIREAKLTMLSSLQRLAKQANSPNDQPNEIWETVYNAVYYLGLDLDKNQFSPMLNEVEAAISRLFES